MSKGLEALKEIKGKFFKQKGNTTSGDFGLYRRLSIIEEELKAFEIIKEKIMPLLSVDEIKYFKIYPIDDEGVEISKEEYDLLKEVLICK